MLLENEIAVVTGAGQGNGAAIAEGLAREGAHVAVVDIDGATAASTAAAIRSKGLQAEAFEADVSDWAACRNLAESVGQRLGSAAILVNNAGICPRAGFADPDAKAVWDSVIGVNLTGPAQMIMAFLPDLRANAGRIINITSIAAEISTRTSAVYAASKGGLKTLTVALAQELAVDGIRVNAVAPGPFATQLTEQSRQDSARLETFLRRMPMQRYGDPEEIVGPVVFLASAKSSFVTGSTLVVDGGYLTN